MRERNRGLERVADYVREIAVAAETMAELRGGPVALRMDEDEDAERLCFGSKWVERTMDARSGAPLGALRARYGHACDCRQRDITSCCGLGNQKIFLLGLPTLRRAGFTPLLQKTITYFNAGNRHPGSTGVRQVQPVTA